ncbi:unnamed protein product, partial [Ixodes hexagonus]
MDIKEGSPEDSKTIPPYLCQDGVTERPWLDPPMPWYAKILWWLLSFAQLPSSVAFTLDGNRRWAKERGLTPQEGHDIGTPILEKARTPTMLALGIRRTNVYIFTMNNFRRREDQVWHILDIISRIYDSICKNWQFYHKKGSSVKFPGYLDLFPEEAHRPAAKAELMLHNKSSEFQLSYCAPYLSRHQGARMALALCHAVRDGLLEPRDITERLIDLYNEIEDCPAIDCMLRAAGEHRLSDFLTWQSERAYIFFETKRLPDIAMWDIFKMMLHYSATPSSRKVL